jgi:hypothetical protein
MSEKSHLELRLPEMQPSHDNTGTDHPLDSSHCGLELRQENRRRVHPLHKMIYQEALGSIRLRKLVDFVSRMRTFRVLSLLRLVS